VSGKAAKKYINRLISLYLMYFNLAPLRETPYLFKKIKTVILYQPTTFYYEEN